MQSGYPRNASAIIFGLLLTNETLLVIVNAVNLTLNRSGPNPTYSARGGSNLTTFENRSSRPQKGSKSEIIIFYANFQIILNNFCFYGNVEKIIFGPLLYDQKPIFAPNIG